MPNQYSNAELGPVCPECGAHEPAHKLTCPVLLSPNARKEFLRRKVWRRRNAQEAVAKKAKKKRA